MATASNASPETMASNIKKINRFILPYFSFEVISGNQMCILDVTAFKKVSFHKSNTVSLRISIKNNKNELGSYTHTSSEAGDYSFDVAAYKYFAVDYGQKPIFENFKLKPNQYTAYTRIPADADTYLRHVRSPLYVSPLHAIP